MTSRERVLAFLKGQPVDRLPLMPITMMFACDRIGARYRDYCTDYRVLVEGQIRTSDEFGFDYVNTMSDPAREAVDCGAIVEYFDQQPVALIEDQALLADKTTLARLKVPDPLAGGRMHNAVLAVSRLKERVGGQKVVEGWVEGPIAEGADLRGINTLMTDFFDDIPFVQALFEFVIEMELRFARAQIEAGADVIGVGDAAASLVGPSIYEEIRLAVTRNGWWTASMPSAARCGSTSAATPAGCWSRWGGWVVTSSISTRSARCPRRGRKWGRIRSSWAI